MRPFLNHSTSELIGRVVKWQRWPFAEWLSGQWMLWSSSRGGQEHYCHPLSFHVRMHIVDHYGLIVAQRLTNSEIASFYVRKTAASQKNDMITMKL